MYESLSDFEAICLQAHFLFALRQTSSKQERERLLLHLQDIAKRLLPFYTQACKRPDLPIQVRNTYTCLQNLAVATQTINRHHAVYPLLHSKEDYPVC